MRLPIPLLLAAGFVGSLAAQSNTVVGLDGRLTNNSSPTYFGRRGPAYPNGEIGMSYSYTMCNPGTTSIAWNAPMNSLQPMFSYMVVRESNGRMEQISNDRSFAKHAFGAANASSTCGTCQSSGFGLRVGCSDTYGASLNANRTYLGPTSEIDPWTGIWNPVGSYFDRGDPDVGTPGNQDGVRSLTNTTSGVFVDPVLNRVTLKEQDLLVPGRLFYGMHIIVTGEDGDLHFDNIGHRQMLPSWNGSTWSFTDGPVGFTPGSVLNQWAGASIHSARNGEDDGHFIVASKVTPIAGGFHYEYAVHNFDNNRSGAALHVPVAPGATVTNLGCRDTDDDALNQWSMTRIGNEIVFQAAANNPLNWNNLYNFWFDCTQAPSLGLVTLDEARVGPGNLQVNVFADVPSGIPTAFNTSVGIGCAGPATSCQASVYESFAAATFDLANTSMGCSFNGADYTIGPASGTYTAPTGTSLLSGDDVETSVTLPFPLSFPGGSTTQLVVCTNGFVSVASNGTDFTPTSGELLSGNARWCAAWHDLNVTAGQVLLDSSPSAVRVSFTNVPTLGGTGSHTFQFEFLPNNQVNIYWQNMTTTGSAYLVGWSAGHDTLDPGNANLSAVIQATNLTLCPGSFVTQPLALAAGSRPVLGTTVPMTTSNIPVGSGAQGLIYSFALASPAIDLTPIGMQGCLAHMTSFDVFALNVGPGTTHLDNVAVPNLPVLVGTTVAMQAISYSPPRTTFGWLSSNAILMFLAGQ